MALVLGWQFTLGEFVGGPLMIVLLALALPRLPHAAARRRSPRRGGARAGSARWRATPRWTCRSRRRLALAQRLRSPAGFTATSHVFVMEWAAILRDIAIGLLVAGALGRVGARLVVAGALPHRPSEARRSSGGRSSGRSSRSSASSARSGTCRSRRCCGTAGISFGGVIAFIFADLIILPILDIYRRYYGWRIAGFLLATLYRGDGVGGAGRRLALRRRRSRPRGSACQGRGRLRRPLARGDDLVLDVAALLVSAVLVWRFFTTGGGPMLRMMDQPVGGGHDHSHHHAHAR